MRRMIKERRHHIVYITRNTEYHCRDLECVGVRERSSGRWARDHPALRSRLMGALLQGTQGLHRPQEGLRLVFNGNQLVKTTRVLLAGRPDKSAIYAYTSLCRSGVIGA